MACTAIVHVSKSGLHLDTSIQEIQLYDDQGHVFHCNFHIYRKGLGMKVFFGPLSYKRSCQWAVVFLFLVSVVLVSSLVPCCAWIQVRFIIVFRSQVSFCL